LKLSENEAAAGHPPSGRPADSDAGAAAGAGSGLVQVLFRFVEEIVGSASTLIEVQTDRIKLSVQRKMVQAAVGAAAALCLALWLGAAALATVRGICGGFASLWGGRVWLGDLAGGVLALTLAGGAIALYLRVSERRELERLEHKYERIRSKQDHSQDPPATAPDRGAAARPGGSPGAPAARGLGAEPR
jgi:hypothetical protein